MSMAVIACYTGNVAVKVVKLREMACRKTDHSPVSEATCILNPSIRVSGTFHVICTVFSFKILNLKSEGGSTVKNNLPMLTPAFAKNKCIYD